MTEELKVENKQPKAEQIKMPEQQEKERIELLKLISEKIPTFWEKDYNDISITELVTMIDSAVPELKKEIVDEILEKYYDNCETNRSSNIFIEAPHGKAPSLTETELMIKQYEEFKNVDAETVESIFSKVIEEVLDTENTREQTFNARSAKLKEACRQNIIERTEFIDRMMISENGNEVGRGQFITKAQKDVLENELKLTILKVMSGSDIYTPQLTYDVAGSAYNYTIPDVSRKRNAFGRKPGSRKIVKKTKRLESGHGGALAQHYAIERIMKKQNFVHDGENKFYHVLLQERDSREPFSIGISSYEGEYACDPEIAIFVAEKLEERLKETEMVDGKGVAYKVSIPKQGEKYNGNPVNRHRRLGKDKFKGIELGENYNAIQIGIPSLALKKYGDKVAIILKEILEELK